MTYDRFKAEQDLQAAWNVTSDLSTLAEGVLEHGLTLDQIANVTIGLADLYNIRFDKVWRNLADSVREDIQKAPLVSPDVDELIQIRALVAELIHFLSVRVGDESLGELYNPNRIVSGRAQDGMRIKDIMRELNELVNESN